MVQALLIVLISIVAAVVYGIMHDQVTARICVEYFTIGHPPVFVTESPTLLGFGWGVLATWWVGLALGLLLAASARLGSRPRRSARSLCKPITLLLMVSATCAVLAGLVGYVAARRGLVVLVEPLASRVPPEKHVAFLVDLWAHSASYLAGSVGGVVLAISVWRSRRRDGRQPAG